MKLIDIKTTQNVTISYELAGLKERIIATIIDWAVIMISVFVISWLLLVTFGDFDNSFFMVLDLVIIIPIIVFYIPAMEILNNGQTLGKLAMRIRVVKLDGKQLKVFDFLLRWAFRLIDVVLSFGAIAGILVSSTDYGQRLGGLVSNSTVVMLKPSQYIGLNDILKIKTQDTYEPVYPMVRNLCEEDVLVMKSTLDRYREYKNDAHKEAVLELCELIKEKFELEQLPKDKLGFLKTLIKDYIVLTR